MASKKITEMSEKLAYIKNNVCKVSEDKLKAAINSLTKEKSAATLMRIFTDLNNSFAEEEERLEHDEEHHNKRYANEDNAKYSTAYNSLSNIKTSIFSIYKIYNLFSKRKPHAFYGNKTNTKSIEFSHDHTIVGGLSCPGYLFDNMTACQRRLLDEMTYFFAYLERNIDRCLRIIEEEEAIGENQEACLRLLENQIEEAYQYTKGDSVKSLNEPFFNDLLDVENKPENAQIWFHKITPKQLAQVSKAKRMEKLEKYTPLQRKVFNDNPVSIDRFIKVVSLLDKCTSKITGDTIMFVQRYTECKGSQSAFYDCFVQTYKQIEGMNHIVSKQRFNQSWTEYSSGEHKDYESFCTKMDILMI